MKPGQDKDDLLLDAAGEVLAGRDGRAFRAQSPEHEAAYERMAGAWAEIDSFRDQIDLDHLMGPEHPRARLVRWRHALADLFAAPLRRPAWTLAASLCMLLLVGTLSVRLWDSRRAPDYATATAEVRAVRLPDGSLVTLGPRSELAVAFSDAERRVRLSGGEAFFEVAKNPARPFIVAAGDTVVRVLGTKFDVNASSDTVRVAVLEGRVQVARRTQGLLPRTPQPIATLAAGEAIAVPAAARTDTAAPSPAVAAAEPGSWREGRRSYDDVPLAEVIADANRYYAHEIRLADPALGHQRVTTSFRSGQIDQMLDTLDGAPTLSVERQADGSVLIREKWQNSAL